MSENNENMENKLENRDGKIIPIEISTEVQQSFLQYAMSVIVSRALPDVRDGLKPVHRRILYTMYEKNLTPDRPYHKCADTVGSVLGSYHPHGDSSVYDALVRLAQPFSMRYMLVDGQGNFGSVDGDPPAAYRYTEARMSKIALEMLTDIQKETVPFMPNYDERLMEPVVLPSRYPNLLVNGSIGIAVGMATNIPPHNLGEVVDGIELLMDEPDCTIEEIMEKIKGPDFPTGGIIMGKAGIRAAYNTGRGKITLRSKVEFEKVRGRDAIIVTEIPYMVNKARLVESIAQLAKEKRVEGIAHIQDESSREGMRIVIELKKDTNAEIVLNKLYSYTQLQDTVGVIMIALVNGEPKVLSIKQILEHYLNFQIEVITNRTKFELAKAKKRAHILQGFLVAIDNVDEVIRILRSSQTIPEGKQRLIERFKDIDMTDLLDRSEYDMTHYNFDAQMGLTSEQADAIVQMHFGALTGMERKKVTDELYEITKKIAEYIEILSDENLVKDIIRNDLREIARRFSDDRRTMIENVCGEVEIEDLIPVTECVVTYTNGGYLKRMPSDTYKLQRRGGRGVNGMKQRAEDYVSEMFISSSHDHVMFISNKGIMYKLKCYEIPEGGKTSKGLNIVNLITMDEDEHISAILHTSDFEEGKFVNIVTKKGKIKRTALSAYKNVRKNGLIAIGLDEDDEIAGVVMTEGNDNIFIATRNGMILRTNENNVRPMSRSAHGVRAISLKENDEVASIARERDNAELLTITTNGYGRRSNADEYRIQNRGGFGIKNYNIDSERGYVCGIRMVESDEDIILISSDGVIIRVRCEDIRIMGRTAKGVRTMKVTSGNTVVAFTSAPHDESSEISDIESENISDEEVNTENAQVNTVSDTN